MNSRIINVRIPSQNKTISTPAFLSRLVFCLNHHKLCTKSVTLENNTVSIVFESYPKFIKWIGGIHSRSNANAYNLIKNNTSISVTLPDYESDSKSLIATWTFPKAKAKALDATVFKLLRS